MDFITKEVQETLGLTTEMIAGITPLYDASLAESKKGWDGLALENTDKIINDMVTSTNTHFGTDIQREDKEKTKDFLVRLSNTVAAKAKTSYEAKALDYDTKLKDFKGDEATAAELLKTKTDLDSLMQKTADYDTLKENSDKLTPLQEQYGAMKKQVAWGGVKPSFPETINEYEAAAKWAECIDNIEKEYNIEFDGEKAVGVNKENHHNVVALKDLVGKNEDIAKLMEGRQQTGANGKQIPPVKIEGIPFDVPANADSKQIITLIRAQLAKEGINPVTDAVKSAARFKEIYDKIPQQTA